MIEALKLIMLACQLIAPPQFDSGSLTLTDQAMENQKQSLVNQISTQRECQKQLIRCWLENKKQKVKWPLSTCLGEENG